MHEHNIFLQVMLQWTYTLGAIVSLDAYQKVKFLDDVVYWLSDFLDLVKEFYKYILVRVN